MLYQLYTRMESKCAGPYSLPLNEVTKKDGKFSFLFQSVLLFSHTVPSSYPVDVMVEPLSQTQVILQWNPVPPIDRNGIITHYEVLFNQSSLTTLPKSNYINVTELNATVSPLQPFLNYTLYVRAYTSVGPGPFNPTPVTTMTDPSGSMIVSRTQCTHTPYSL